MPKRTSVDSSSLASISYDETSHTLEVEFRNGSLYAYFDVPDSAYAALLAADSKGQHFNASIRSCYPYSRIRRASRGRTHRRGD